MDRSVIVARMVPSPDPKEAPPPADPASDAGKKKEPPPDPNALSPEEQMERFAEKLKEDDWGHQPC